MTTNTLNTSLTLLNDKVRFAGTARNNPAVVMDYFPPAGDGEGYTGLEMLLLSLSCCSSTAVKILLQKMNKTVNALTADATGIRQETAPFAFTRIDLYFSIISGDCSPADVEKAIHLAETSMCPVWAMVRGNVRVDVTYRLRPH